MKRKKLVKTHRTHRIHRAMRFAEKYYFGLDGDFILIFGGGFLVIVLGLMILSR
jgi:hypothetical protein